MSKPRSVPQSSGHSSPPGELTAASGLAGHASAESNGAGIAAPSLSTGTLPTYKLIILGESNVGKSSLFLRYTEDRFKTAIANTIGVNNSLKEVVVDGKTLRLQMWDTAGQERFRSIVSVFYRESDGFVLVYDVGSRRSFEYVKELMEELRDVIDPRFGVVVGNKIDRLDEDEMQEEARTLRELAARYGFQWQLASAKTGAGVAEIFEDLAKRLARGKEHRSRRTGVDITRRRKRRFKWCYR